MTKLADRLRATALGKELSAPEAEALAALMSLNTLSDGDYLLKEEETDEALHVLLSGKLEVVKQAGAGELASLAVLREGDLAGELGFVDGTAHTVGLRALCKSEVCTLTRTDFEALITSNPALLYKVMRAVVRSAHRIVRRMNIDFIELSNYIFKQHGRY